MRSRSVALGLAAVLVVYLAAVGYRGVLLVRDGRPAFVLLGFGVLLLLLVGAWVVLAELRFGRRTEALARELDAEGGLPADELRRTPGGRIDRASADEVFERRRAEVDGAPEDWRGWYRLGVAYGDAGDRPRGRRALRHAIRLYDEQRERPGS
ncbi:MAG: hypothetical protein M3P48_09225 [Actinomycetota bacterium]|nr:hypothetical protein [Actinomycetota bacterium]